MQTRAAARKLVEAIATATTTTTVAAPLEASEAQTPIDTPTPTRKLVEAIATATTTAAPPDTSQAQASSDTANPTNGDVHDSKATTARKRKRVTKKPAQPLKGGWVLPHGMGVGVAGADASSFKGDESTPVSSPADLPITAPGPAESGLSAVASRPNSKTNAPKQTRQTRQTRISLRVTKAGVTGQKDDEKKQEPAVKLEELDDSVSLPIKQEDVRPTKRARTALSATVKASEITSTEGDALEVAQVKVEKKDTTSQSTPKLLVIKGIIIRDNTAAKTLDKIIVDATQLLDPNFRRMIKRGKENPYGLTPGFSPYTYRRVPTAEACEEVHAILTELHGEVKQPEKMPAASLEVAGCGEVPCVLDALLRTLISGNTLMALADAAVKNLGQHYGVRTEGAGAGSINWDKVRLSSHQELVQVIRVAGNGPKRSSHIKQILDMVYKENLERTKEQSASSAVAGDSEATKTVKATDAEDLLSLDYMHGMDKDEALAKFVSYPGIGIKTAACVTLFCLRMPCFAVDTHVHKFCRWLGWVPEKADPDNCFRHGDFMVPDHLKYGLHQLFIRHGQMCFKCRKATKPGTKEWDKADSCPLEHLLDRSTDEAGPKVKPKKPVKEDTSSGTEDLESDDSESEEDDGEED